MLNTNTRNLAAIKGDWVTHKITPRTLDPDPVYGSVLVSQLVNRLMLNGMLASGLYSNWWLNPTGMTNEDLAWVNEPGSAWDDSTASMAGWDGTSGTGTTAS